MRMILATLTCLLGLAAPALAADPLLSGYAGPGSGDQSVLGTTLVTPKPGGGSLAQTGPARASGTGSASAPGTAPGTPAAGGGSSSSPDGTSGGSSNGTDGSGGSSASGGSGGSGTASGSGSGAKSTDGTPSGGSGSTATSPRTPAVASERAASSASASTALPFSAGELALALAGIVLLAGLAWTTARVGDGASPA